MVVGLHNSKVQLGPDEVRVEHWRVVSPIYDDPASATLMEHTSRSVLSCTAGDEEVHDQHQR